MQTGNVFRLFLYIVNDYECYSTYLMLPVEFRLLLTEELNVHHEVMIDTGLAL